MRISHRSYQFLVLILVVLPLLATSAAAVLLWKRYVFPLDIVLLISGTVLTGLGIGIGYHRMLTHEGFQTYPFVRAFFLILGVMGFMGDPSSWAGIHIKHHAHSDQDDDPHSPLDGFWHAHLGWIFTSEDEKEVGKYVPHLLKDPVVRFVDQTTLLWMVISLLIPYLIGGWTGLLWGGGVRIFLSTHITWSVNSICHCFGSRPFETTDESRNNWLIGLISYGEGWHNNHHAFPRNAFHGLQWWQFDLSGLLIRALEALGLIWNVQRVGKEVIKAQQIRGQTMRESLTRLREELSAKVLQARREVEMLLKRRLDAAVDPVKLQEVIGACEGALRRLEQIRNNVTRVEHMRKQQLLLYAREVGELIASLKQRMTPLAMLE